MRDAFGTRLVIKFEHLYFFPASTFRGDPRLNLSAFVIFYCVILKAIHDQIRAFLHFFPAAILKTMRD